MSEKERADEDIRVYDHKFKKEFWRSALFWTCIAGATIWVFNPHEFDFYLKGKVFENRTLLIDDFIVKSDTFTKTVLNIIYDEDWEAMKLYREDHYNEYNLQLARMETSFGDDIYGLTKKARDQSDILKCEMDNVISKIKQNEYKKIDEENAVSEQKKLVSFNIEITRKATELQYQGAQIPPEYTKYIPREKIKCE